MVLGCPASNISGLTGMWLYQGSALCSIFRLLRYFQLAAKFPFSHSHRKKSELLAGVATPTVSEQPRLSWAFLPLLQGVCLTVSGLCGIILALPNQHCKLNFQAGWWEVAAWGPRLLEMVCANSTYWDHGVTCLKPVCRFQPLVCLSCFYPALILHCLQLLLPRAQEWVKTGGDSRAACS